MSYHMLGSEIHGLLGKFDPSVEDPGAQLFKLRAQIAAQLFVGSVRNENGAREAVEEADMLLKELLK